MNIREYRGDDIPAMAQIWNTVVTDGIAFPQLDTLDRAAAAEFFAAQSFTAVASDGGQIVGLYILHPNNVGRCGHIANSSYAVSSSARGRGVGAALVAHSLEMGKTLGFKLLQFNAVVKTNMPALHIYERLGFVRIGEIPGGFLMKDGHYEDIVLFYHTLD